MTKLATLATLIALPLLAAAALAQETLDAEVVEEVEIRRYTVEMIIFSYAQDVSTGSEIFVADEPIVDDELPLLEELQDELPEEPQEEIEVSPETESDETGEDEYALVLLAEEDYTLGDVLDEMERLDIYQPLMHFGWTQPTLPEEDTVALELQSLAMPPQGLAGSLTLYLSRYLHLVVDLQLDEADSTAPDYIFGGYDLHHYDEPDSPPVRYRITENRIIRNGELRYFDHPKFGVLARITRYEEEQEPTSEELFEETELLGYDGE
jgi:hypothetical protein